MYKRDKVAILKFALRFCCGNTYAIKPVLTRKIYVTFVRYKSSARLVGLVNKSCDIVFSTLFILNADQVPVQPIVEAIQCFFSSLYGLYA
jgi:hypothetical protein